MQHTFACLEQQSFQLLADTSAACSADLSATSVDQPQPNNFCPTASLDNPPSTFATSMDELAWYESFISPAVLRGTRSRLPFKNATLSQSTRSNNADPAREFRETVFALNTIVKRKLYRHFLLAEHFGSSQQNSKIEDYFARWGVSRAQAYRYLDCASVLMVSSSRKADDFPEYASFSNSLP